MYLFFCCVKLLRNGILIILVGSKTNVDRSLGTSGLGPIIGSFGAISGRFRVDVYDDFYDDFYDAFHDDFYDES